MDKNIVTTLKQKVESYKEEIQKIEIAIQVIERNSGPGLFGHSSDHAVKKVKTERKVRAPKKDSPEKNKSASPVVKKPISKQVVDYLSEVNRFLLPAEIVNELAERTGKKPAGVKLLVNQTLSRLKKEAKLVSYKPEKSRSHVWGFQAWLNDQKEPIGDFLPTASE